MAAAPRRPKMHALEEQHIMRTILTLVFCGLMLAPTGLAQDEKQAKAPQRAKRPPRVRTYDATMGLREVAKHLKSDLELDDAQKSQLDELAKTVARNTAREGRTDPRRLLSDMRKAGGDADALAAIKSELRPLRERQVLALLDEIKPILTDAQLRKLERIAAPLHQRTPRWKSALMESLALLRHDLGLDEEHAAAFDQAVAALRADLFATGPKLEKMDKDELLAKVQEALASKDPDAIRNLRSQLKTNQPDAELALVRFIAELDRQLNDAQRPTLVEFVERLMSMPNKTGTARDPRQLIQIARQNSLNREQRDAMRAIERDFNKASRGDNEKRFASLYECAIRITEVLTRPQLNAFRRVLDGDLETSAEPDDQRADSANKHKKAKKSASEGGGKKKKTKAAGEEEGGQEP
ncbi:MAG: hypothetical protein D6744_08795 [Planctomycetota bacterium]|nr:MAG: hypothetical protein D6744_08795 [Planctomycetota bacterium]